MKKSFLFVLIVCSLVCSTKLSAQIKKDSITSNYAVLYITTRGNDVLLTANDSVVVDLKTKIHFKDYNWDNPSYSYEAYVFLKCAEYLEKQNFELVSSLGYETSYTTNSKHAKEYIFRRKK